MILADLNNLSINYGGRTIFSGLQWTIKDDDRIGLVGPNGIGKSSLLRLLAGTETPETGTVVLRRGARVAYLAQEYQGQADRSMLAELLASRSDLAQLEAQIASVEAQLGDPDVYGDMKRMARVLEQHEKLLDQYNQLGGSGIESHAKNLLGELGFTPEQWDQPMGQLSGGQQKLVGLACCLLNQPDLLLLDEPDNHLDLENKAQLEQIIQRFDGAVILISHDRYLLDDTISVIMEMDVTRSGKVQLVRWEGNYSSYATQKELAQLKQQQDYVSQQKEIDRLEAAISRFRVWLNISLDKRHKTRIENKQRQLDRMDKIERPVLERRKIALNFRPQLRGGAKAIELRHVSKILGDRIMFDNANVTIMNGERVGIVGANGVGKSLLLQLMLGNLPLDEGEIWVGPSIQLGYYAQQHETLDMQQTPVESLRSLRPMYEEEAVARLGRFLIPYASCHAPIAKLSGGQKSRVQLARLLLTQANCLLLDEPTNNLDIDTAEVLEQSLDQFAGSVIVVSHDRYFLDRVVDRIIEIRDGQLRVYEGGYSYYQEHR
jgi:ATP-binding cassette subfamily F protein 3